LSGKEEDHSFVRNARIFLCRDSGLGSRSGRVQFVARPRQKLFPAEQFKILKRRFLVPQSPRRVNSFTSTFSEFRGKILPRDICSLEAGPDRPVAARDRRVLSLWPQPRNRCHDIKKLPRGLHPLARREGERRVCARTTAAMSSGIL